MYTCILFIIYFIIGLMIDIWLQDDEDLVKDEWSGAGYSFTIVCFWPIILLVALICKLFVFKNKGE